jgi:hypothetical protein
MSVGSKTGALGEASSPSMLITTAARSGKEADGLIAWPRISLISNCAPIFLHIIVPIGPSSRQFNSRERAEYPIRRFYRWRAFAPWQEQSS